MPPKKPYSSSFFSSSSSSFLIQNNANGKIKYQSRKAVNRNGRSEEILTDINRSQRNTPIKLRIKKIKNGQVVDNRRFIKG